MLALTVPSFRVSVNVYVGVARGGQLGFPFSGFGQAGAGHQAAKYPPAHRCLDRTMFDRVDDDGDHV
jgi:hypothetical protein